jgi:hypothetical protein
LDTYVDTTPGWFWRYFGALMEAKINSPKGGGYKL